MSSHFTNSSIYSRMKTRFSSAKQRGFSLVEMAIVLVIVGLLVTGGVTIFASQQDMRRVQETQTILDVAKDSLIGYAATHVDGANHPFLPCPDKTTAAGVGTANDGQEDRIVVGAGAGACVVVPGASGNLPWVTLGLPDSDSWSNRLRYQVTPAFSNSTTGMTLASTGNITINNAAGTALSTLIPAIILSHGKNGFGAQNSSGSTNTAPTGASELENTDANTTFISNSPVGLGGTGGEFDDLVIWISPNILFNRMLAAGRLP